MQGKLMMTGMVAALGLMAGTAQADDRLGLDQVDRVLSQGSAFGIQHYEEIEAKGRDSVEIEGWLDQEWYADVRLSLQTGESLKEERKRLVSGAWGMSEDDVRQAFEAAGAEGMASFEEIKIDERGMIEIEGEDDSGRELEVQVRQGEAAVASVEHDD